MKKITVFVITYNQEKVIAQTLDSILNQKEWGLYQIIIGDDCSKDRTWEIILKYQSLFPDIIYPYRNSHNIGIYENLESVIEKRDKKSDLFLITAGDDPLCIGFFAAIQELIEKKNINTDTMVGIYSDWKTVDSNGKEVLYSQKECLSGHPLWSLYIRGIITNRSLLISHGVIDRFEPVIKDKGLNLAESMFDSQAHRIITMAYYLPQVTSIYRTGVGISSKLGKTDYYTTQHITKWQYYIDNYVNSKKDRYFAKSQVIKGDFFQKPSLFKYLSFVYYYIKGQYYDCINIRGMLIDFYELARFAIKN